MATTAELLGSAGPGTTITIGDSVYTLTRSTKSIHAAWSKWLTDRAEAAVFATSDKYMTMAVKKFEEADEITRRYESVDIKDISPQENVEATAKRDSALFAGRQYQRKSSECVERFDDRVAAGEFEFYGNVSIELVQQGMPGQIMMVFLCLQPKHPDITVEKVTKLHLNPLDDGENYIKEWRDALLKSEGVVQKKGLSSSTQTEAGDRTSTKS